MKEKNFKPELPLCWLTIFAYLVFGNMLTFDLGNRMPIKAAEILSIILILSFILGRGRGELYVLKYKKLFIWMCIGLVSSIVNALRYNYGLFNFTYGTIYLARLLHLVALVSIISAVMRKNKVQLETILDVILISYIIVCILGILQLIFYPNALDYYKIFEKIGVYSSKNPDPHKGRMLSTYFDPNYLASCLVIPFAIALNRWKKDGNIKYMCCMLLFFYSVVVTVSRSGFLGICIVDFLSLIEKPKSESDRRRRIILLILTIVLGLALYFGNARILGRISNSADDPSSHKRIEDWLLGLSIAAHNIILGIGYNMTGAYKMLVLGMPSGTTKLYGNDSSLLLILMTTGIIGALYAAYAIITGLLNMKTKGKKRSIIVQVVIASLVICNFNNLLFYILWLFPVMLIINLFADYEETESYLEKY